ncbi:MAG: acyl-CoA dehydrogenase family protein, partial [Acidimicrobiales bacterium]
ADPDTWVASPYAPSGTAVLGAVIPGEGATPAGMLHIMLPRSDYEIVPDSWNVIGLAGTGSKDVIVRNAFVPDYRTIDVFKVLNGQAATEAGRRQPLYRMPWSTMFPCAVSAGVVGIAEGVLKHAVEYQRGRVSAIGTAQASDPYSRATIGEAAADIRSARAQLVSNVGELYDAVCAGHEVTIEQRVACRRDQVRVAWRAAKAADDVYAVCGGNAIRLDKPLQRFWRGMHAGLHHGIFVAGPVYDAAAGMLMGQPPQGPAAATI